VHVAHR